MEQNEETERETKQDTPNKETSIETKSGIYRGLFFSSTPE